MVQAYDYIHGFAIGLHIHESSPTARLPAQRQKPENPARLPLAR
jgi:hypothetical protein